MNAFADWLFSVLLGWTGGAANRAWNAIVNNDGGISGFFARFWLPIVLLLIVAGTLVDYAVWFARWRPYLVWRSWLTRRRRHRNMTQEAQQLAHGDMDPQTREAIADWVIAPQDYSVYADMPQEVAEPPYADYQAAPQDWPAPEETNNWAYMPPVQEAAPTPYPVPEPAPEQPAAWYPAEVPEPYLQDMPVDPPAPVVPPFQFPREEEQAPMDWFSQLPVSPYQENTGNAPAPQSAPRRRRSERSRQTRALELLSNLRERLGTTEDEDSMIDGLPSPVKEQDAFHEAVYPTNYRYVPNNEPLPPAQQEEEQNGY